MSLVTIHGETPDLLSVHSTRHSRLSTYVAWTVRRCSSAEKLHSLTEPVRFGDVLLRKSVIWVDARFVKRKE